MDSQLVDFRKLFLTLFRRRQEGFIIFLTLVEHFTLIIDFSPKEGRVG